MNLIDEGIINSLKKIHNMEDLLGIIIIDSKLFNSSIYDIWCPGYLPHIYYGSGKLSFSCEEISQTDNRNMTCVIDIEIKNFNVIKYSDCNISVTLEDPECRSMLDGISTRDKYILLCILSDKIKIISIRYELDNVILDEFSKYNCWEFPKDVSNIKGSKLL